VWAWGSSSAFDWDRYIGATGAFVGVEGRFSASAPYKDDGRRVRPYQAAAGSSRYLGAGAVECKAEEAGVRGSRGVILATKDS